MLTPQAIFQDQKAPTAFSDGVRPQPRCASSPRSSIRRTRPYSASLIFQ